MRISKSSDAKGKTMGSFLPDGTNVNHELVKDGWWYWKYAPGDTVWERFKLRIARNDKGIAHVINDLSNPLVSVL
ncbi:MAG: hypothetical protein ABIQ24_06860 [Nitrospiraceae bacterium]